MTKTRTGRILVAIVIAFVVYAVVTSPAQAGDLVKEAFNIVAGAVQSLFRFFDRILAH